MGVEILYIFSIESCFILGIPESSLVMAMNSNKFSNITFVQNLII